MNPALITALATGIPAILGAVTALVVAIKSGKAANNASEAVGAHLQAHDNSN